jgi:hypothetical protein
MPSFLLSCERSVPPCWRVSDEEVHMISRVQMKKYAMLGRVQMKKYS